MSLLRSAFARLLAWGLGGYRLRRSALQYRRKRPGKRVESLAEDGNPAALGLYLQRTYGSASGRGLWIFSPAGKHLGTMIPPEHLHNLAWGDDDGKTLYLAARTSIYRIRLSIPGVRP